MGKVINSTNLIESAMKNKSRLPKNMSKDNYYLKRLQQKVDYEWDYRYKKLLKNYYGEVKEEGNE